MLKVYQSLWAMDGLPGVDLEHHVEGALDRIVAAGFDGVGVNLARTARAEATARWMAGEGLSWEAQALVRDADQLACYLDQAIALGAASHVNIQVANVAASVGEAIDLMASLLEVSRGCPIPIFYETHRGRLLNDLFWTVDILDALPDLTLTGDLSHYVTAHELDLPLAPHLAQRLDRVIARCGAFHLRIAGPNQIQLPVEAETSAAWRAMFESWWRAGMQAKTDGLTVLCELGPPPYAITDPTGRELTDRWTEALALKAMSHRLFSEAS